MFLDRINPEGGAGRAAPSVFAGVTEPASAQRGHENKNRPGRSRGRQLRRPIRSAQLPTMAHRPARGGN